MKIYFLNGSEAGSSLELDRDSLKLGRELDNDISLSTGGVSRYHAVLQRTDKGIWMVSDVGSTNGTKINGKQIDLPTQLEEGDVISLGDQNIRFGEKKDLAKDVAEVLRNTAILENTTPKVVFHTSAAPSDPTEMKIKPVFSIKAAPEEQPKSDPAKPEPPKSELEPEKTDLSIFENKNLNLFQKKKKPEAAGDEAKKVRRLSSTLLFYTVILAIIILFGVGFHFFNEQSNQKPPPVEEKQTEKKAPFVLRYVKESVNGDNIFRFSLDIDGEKATFCIDDLKSKRHYEKKIDVQSAYLTTLQKDIQATDFFSLEPEHAGTVAVGQSNMRRLLIAANYKFNDVTVRDTYAPNSFETIAQSIDIFASHYNLFTIAMTVNEILKLAQDDFNVGEDLFRNREANPGNLLKAKLRYQMVVENLEPFQPKPEIWDRARKREQEVDTILSKMEGDLNFEYSRRYRMKDWEGAREIVIAMMQILPEDSKGYERCSESRLELDRKIREMKKR